MEDPIVQEMIDKGYGVPNPDGTYRLTEKGERAFIQMVQSDPKFYAKQFPEWVKIENIH